MTFACYAQGSIKRVKGLSLVRMPSHVHATAFGDMHELQILIMDGVDFGRAQIRAKMPDLGLVSWKEGKGDRLPFTFEAIQNAAVLDLKHCSRLKQLPDMQVHSRLLPPGMWPCEDEQCILAFLPCAM